MAKRKRKKISAWWLLVPLLLLSMAAAVGYGKWYGPKVKLVRYTAFGIPVPENFSVHGIDVSRYQQTIAWEEVKAMQVDNIRIRFAFIKATEGISKRDEQFNRNWKKSKQAGLIRGAYHFFLATKDGREQAEHFINSVDLAPGDLPPVVDIEQTYGVNTATLKKELKEWLDIVEQHYKVKPVIYTYVDFYEQHLAAEFDSYPLWAAHYFQYNEPRISRNWIFWQHSDEGRVSGITPKVDFNVFNGDSTEFSSLLIK